MKLLYGITVAMVTPITQGNQVDYGMMGRLTEFLIQKGVNCLYACGTDGEMFHLTTEERMRLAETVVRTAAGRVTVYIHCGAMMEGDTMRLLRHAESIGADGVGIVTPAYFPVNDREMEAYYLTVSQCVSDTFPIYFYNIPQCSANDLKPEAAQRIVRQRPNIVGIKYNYPDINQTLDYTNINHGAFSVLQGDDRTLPAWLALGCYGSVAGSANAFPEPLVASYAAFREGNLKKALEYGKIAARFVDAMHGDTISYFKEALCIRGLDVGYMRPPLLSLTPEESAQLQRDLEGLCGEYGIALKI